MSNKFKGSCLCGKVTFTVNGFSNQVANCHCSMCRKFHGAAYGTLVAVDGLQWLTGICDLKEFVAQNGTTRTFCGNCGSSIGFTSKGSLPGDIEIAVALFDQELPIAVDAQIFTKFKAEWSALQLDIPSFSESRK